MCSVYEMDQFEIEIVGGIADVLRRIESLVERTLKKELKQTEIQDEADELRVVFNVVNREATCSPWLFDDVTDDLWMCLVFASEFCRNFYSRRISETPYFHKYLEYKQLVRGWILDSDYLG